MVIFHGYVSLPEGNVNPGWDFLPWLNGTPPINQPVGVY